MHMHTNTHTHKYVELTQEVDRLLQELEQERENSRMLNADSSAGHIADIQEKNEKMMK